MGWPAILSRLAFAPMPMKDKARVRNPETDVSAALMNATLWQVAGMNGLVPRLMAIVDVAATVVTVRRRWFAWDPNSTLSAAELSFTRTGAGNFTWLLANNQYPDERGNLVTVAFDFSVAQVHGVDVVRSAQSDLNANAISGTVRTFGGGVAADPTRFMLVAY